MHVYTVYKKNKNKNSIKIYIKLEHYQIVISKLPAGSQTCPEFLTIQFAYEYEWKLT